ncbi:MAG TPA: hypothetical protein IAB20_12565 [Candidatus Pullichristensenella excrementipullorum]|nr:hypothetical protein [Candidatus Pullichristensenella excrementipullorum]
MNTSTKAIIATLISAFILALFVAPFSSSSAIAIFFLGILGAFAAGFIATKASDKTAKNDVLMRAYDIKKQHPEFSRYKVFEYSPVEGYNSTVFVPPSDLLAHENVFLYTIWAWTNGSGGSNQHEINYKDMIQCDIIVGDSVINTYSIHSLVLPVSTSVSTTSSEITVRFISNNGQSISFTCARHTADAVFASYTAYAKIHSQANERIEDRSASSNNKTASERMKELNLLLDEGLITKEEFDSKRKNIIEEM